MSYAKYIQSIVLREERSEKPNGNLPLMCRLTVNGEIKQNTNSGLNHNSIVESKKQIDYGAKILVNRLSYNIKNDSRYLLPFVQGIKTPKL